MPSFDVVSKVNMAELDNALQQSQKEIGGRYDFKGLKIEVEKQKDGSFLMKAPTDDKVAAVREIILQKLAKRGISLRNLDLGDVEASGHQAFKQTLKVREGIASDKAKKLVAAIKDSKLKVQASIQGDSLRVTGKSRDDLQSAIALLRGQMDAVETELQFENFRD